MEADKKSASRYLEVSQELQKQEPLKHSDNKFGITLKKQTKQQQKLWVFCLGLFICSFKTNVQLQLVNVN